MAIVLCGACSDDGKTGKNGTACSVAEQADGSVTISCDDGTKSTLVPPSAVAAEGGAVGTTCSVEREAQAVIIR